MNFIKETIPGILLCGVIATVSFFLGKQVPVVGGAVFAILIGMLIAAFWKEKGYFAGGIRFTAKKILQYAVIFLGFGLNLKAVASTGIESLPIILSTIIVSLLTAYFVSKLLKIHPNTSVLIGVGSSICGGSAIAATAPVIDAREDEVAQSVSVIFFFNVVAALIFPTLGGLIGFSTTDGNAFGIFAGTAVNDTSSVTAAASTWDNLYNLGSATLDKAVTVKLTRTLAIIPITLGLAFWKTRKAKQSGGEVNLKKIFPFFILFFILASLITTICQAFGVGESVFVPFKEISKFMIIMAMAAIGLNTDIIKLIKTGGKPLILGFCCSLVITGVSLIAQHLLGLW